ncbi:hypothetical protein [uncultured Sulfuricurvum sp.]|uniref:hypothetical protein n=1 Tax=uncultured Sulfuricurvum sp. TaxID=430693 RepID=UPI00263527A3|nr:hypothetical protein [uncultured Sulfuricurvum sp.]
MIWSKINFGKNNKVQNKTLPQILFIDPDWFFYQYKLKNGYLKRTYGEEADFVYQRARNIKPKDGCYVKYFLHCDNTSYGFSFINKNEAEEKYSEYIETGLFDKDYYTLESDYFTILKRIDLNFPRSLKDYDKKSNRIFINELKNYIFNGAKVTEKKAIDFFENDINFLL